MDRAESVNVFRFKELRKRTRPKKKVNYTGIKHGKGYKRQGNKSNRPEVSIDATC